jgi:hypothetical protein
MDIGLRFYAGDLMQIEPLHSLQNRAAVARKASQRRLH